MLDQLRAAADAGQPVSIVTRACLYACCGRGWHPRSGYEQTYVGKVTHLDDDPTEGSFRLIAAGIGTVSYQVLVYVADLVDVANP